MLREFSIPRKISEKTYVGEIVFTQQPVGGGMLGAAVQLGVDVNLIIGKMEKTTETEFPLYVDFLLVLLVLMLTLYLIAFIYRRRIKENLTS